MSDGEFLLKVSDPENKGWGELFDSDYVKVLMSEDDEEMTAHVLIHAKDGGEWVSFNNVAYELFDEIKNLDCLSFEAMKMRFD